MQSASGGLPGAQQPFALQFAVTSLIRSILAASVVLEIS
jgi:hypothetical protein